MKIEIEFEEELVFTLENTRDENGNLIHQRKHDVMQDIVSETNFSLDENGFRIKEEEFHNEELFRMHDIKVDEQGEMIEEKRNTRVNDDYFKSESYTYEIDYFE